MESKKMAKSRRKRAKKAVGRKRTRKAAPKVTKASVYVNNLLELHKLQGVLLVDLKKEV
jgi:hypothetical protein